MKEDEEKITLTLCENEIDYTIIQITHLILQIVEHSNICGDFGKKYGSVKIFQRKFYAKFDKFM